jgi:hypothetical protein
VFKRVIWMGTGMAVGAGGAFWAKRKVEQTIEQYLPEQVADRAAGAAKDLGRTVKAAAAEGRAAMRATEAELRARVEERTFVGERPVLAGDRSSTAAPAGRAGVRRRPRVPATDADRAVARRRARR